MAVGPPAGRWGSRFRADIHGVTVIFQGSGWWVWSSWHGWAIEDKAVGSTCTWFPSTKLSRKTLFFLAKMFVFYYFGIFYYYNEIFRLLEKEECFMA